MKSYNEIFQEEHEPRDVTKLDTEQIPRHDLICAGFPSQAFSVAGNRQGTDEARGKLFREIVRIAEAHRPEMLLLENVKGLLSQKAVTDGESVEGTKGHAFTEILQALHELGYCLEWRVLNSKNWGVPQNRERVFIIGHLGGEPRQKVFPLERENRENTGQDGREINRVASRYGDQYQDGGVYSKDGLTPTLPVSKGGANPFMVAEGLNTAKDGSAYTIDASYFKGTSPGDIGAGRRTQVLNHQFRPESRPSIEKGQSGGSGLLYNSDYCYALSSSPHYLVDDSFLAMEGELRKYNQIAPSQRSERQGLKVVEPVHTPEFAEKDMNMKSRVGSEDVSMFTVDGSSQHGVIEWKPLQRKRTEKAKEIRRKHRQKHGEDYSPMSEYKFGLKDDESVFHTVTAQPEKSHKLKKEKRIRKLTPKECWRLQGFPDWAFEKAEQVNSDTQLYKQAGNSVTVNVIEALGCKIEEVYFGETDK